jgi:demethylmenaquinone methyltransferase / 2-methoxy-6-polyprenyl-1,4-benzoquinol methylase
MLSREPHASPASTPPWTAHAWAAADKEHAVQGMFTSIARWYDLNNSLLSLGQHHRWKRMAAACVPMMEAGRALDVGAGTGDLALLLAPRVGARGCVFATDLNAAMLREGRRKIQRRRPPAPILCARVNAEALSVRPSSIDAVTAGFCIRNVGRIGAALDEIARALKPGGRFVCLEFSRPTARWLRALYDWYSFRLLPWVGTRVAGDQTGVYRYLPESIRAFPDQEGFRDLLLKAGFRDVTYRNLSGGIVAIHVAIK